jgi:uncharacterized protein (UPF0335 family)
MTQTATNTVEGRAEPYLKRIENLLAHIESEKGACGARCKLIHADIKEVYKEAKNDGVPVKALKGLVKYRALEKKQAAIGDGFDLDEAAEFEQLIDALGDLGIAAARAAGYAPEEDDERDLRPDSLKHNEESRRADQEHLDKLGRGPAS